MVALDRIGWRQRVEPLKTSVHLELASPIVTLCLLQLRKSSNHFANSSVTPYPLKFENFRKRKIEFQLKNNKKMIILMIIDSSQYKKP